MRAGDARGELRLDLGRAGGVIVVDVEDDEERLVGEELVVDEHRASSSVICCARRGVVRLEPRLQPLEERHLALGDIALGHLDRAHRSLDALEALLDEGGVGERRARAPWRRRRGRRQRSSAGAGRSRRRTSATTWMRASQRESWARNCARRALAVAEGLAGEVDVADVGEGELLGLEDLRERVEAGVRHLDDADVRLDAGAVRAGLGVAPRDGVEDGGLAGALEADDAEIHGGRVSRRVAAG